MGAASVEDQVRDLVAPAIEALGCALYDVEVAGSGAGRTFRVLIDREGGVDLDAITAATQAISPLLDADPPVDGPYLLEVSSPGIERPLRRPEHFRDAIGETVTCKHHTDAGPRRERGTLVETDDERIVLEADGKQIVVPRASITQARVVFEWGPQPRARSRGRAKEHR